MVHFEHDLNSVNWQKLQNIKDFEGKHVRLTDTADKHYESIDYCLQIFTKFCCELRQKSGKLTQNQNHENDRTEFVLNFMI